MSRHHLLLLLLILSTLSGCKTESLTQWGQSVWSDDDQAFLSIAQQVEKKTSPLFVYPGYEYPGATLHVADVEGSSEFRPLTTVSGQVVTAFFMRTRGYLVVSRNISKRRDAQQTWIVTKVDLNSGATQQVARATCDTRQSSYDGVVGIPSPDGDQIALAYGCDPGFVAVQVVDAATFEPTNDTVTFDTSNPDGLPLAFDFAWLEDGRVIVRHSNSFFDENATVITPGVDGTATLSNVPPQCYAPPTTSSTINAAGEGLLVEDLNQFEVIPNRGAVVFGCDRDQP